MSFSNFLENEVLDHLCSKGDYIASYMYLALWIGSPLETGAGGSEVSGSGYSRKIMSGAAWNVAVAGTITNFDAVIFSEALENWGNVTHFALFDVSSGGNMLMYGPLQGAPINITVGSIPRFAYGTVAITLD